MWVKKLLPLIFFALEDISLLIFFFGDYEKVALAARCEEHIMDDPESGNRTGKWFFDMILSLGLIDMYDNRFDAIYTRAVVSSFLRREYAANGCGGRLHCGITTRICGGLKSGIRRCGIWTK